MFIPARPALSVLLAVYERVNSKGHQWQRQDGNLCQDSLCMYRPEKGDYDDQ